MMTIVYAYVCGDIIHEGHLLQLENGKALAGKNGRFIVGVLTDEAVMEKKPRPILPFRERLRLIQALKCVDVAVPQEDYSPFNNVKAIQPDILMESASHLGNKYLVDLKKEFKGRIIMTPYYPDQSSTEIKNKIKLNHKVKMKGGCE